MSVDNNKKAAYHELVAYLCLALYSVWLYLPSVQNALGARFAIGCIGIFVLNACLDTAFIRTHYQRFLIILLLCTYLSAHLTIVYTVGIENFGISFPQIFMLFFPFLVVYYLRKTAAKRLCFPLLILVLAVNLITSFVNIHWLLNNSHTARALGFGGAETEYLRRAMSYGIGGFGFTYGLLICINALLLSLPYLRKPLFRWGVVVLVLPMMLAVSLSSYFIATLLLLLSLLAVGIHYLLYAWAKKRNEPYRLRYLLGILGLFLLLIVLFHGVIFDTLYTILKQAGLPDYAQKVQAIQNSLSNPDFERMDLGRVGDYQKGIDTIIRSPWIGIRIDNHHEISGHSTVIDILADSGIPAGIVFFAALCILLKLIYGTFWKTEHAYLFRWLWTVVLLLSLLNVIIFVREAFVLLALGPLYFEFFSTNTPKVK